MNYTNKQQWLINFLIENDNGQFLSPSYIGTMYGKHKHGDKNKYTSYHSAAVSTTLIKLSEIGVIERNSKGHYRSVKPTKQTV